MEEQRASHAKSYCAISTHKLELARFVLTSLTDYTQTKGISHISFFLIVSEAYSKRPYTGSLFNVFLLPERMNVWIFTGTLASIMANVCGLVSFEYLFPRWDCNSTTQSSKNKFSTCERCHLVRLRGWSPLFMHGVGTAQGVTSWFSSNHSH